jgi:hypothetical protein
MFGGLAFLILGNMAIAASSEGGALRAVAVEPLKRRLYMHRIDQIGIFADACRKLPANINTADLTADALLGEGPELPSDTVAIDNFIAAQDGTRAFMIPGRAPDEDRCLFSGVLLEALWGTKQDAFSKVQRDRVTSRSLGAYLKTEVPRIAKSYRITMVPNVSPTFPRTTTSTLPLAPKSSHLPSFRGLRLASQLPSWSFPGRVHGSCSRSGDIGVQATASPSALPT